MRIKKELSPSKENDNSTTLCRLSLIQRPSTATDQSSLLKIGDNNKKSDCSEFGAYNFTSITEYKIGRTLG